MSAFRPPEVAFDRYAFPEPMSGCWLWSGPINGGYGVLSSRGKHMKAHRFSYERSHGPIPSGACVCHRCDNPACVNPDHLFLGTHAENMADMAAKGRADRTSKLYGERIAKKLTIEQARVIRDTSPLDATIGQLAKQLRPLCKVMAEMLEALRKEAPGTPLNNHRFDDLGIRAHDALNRARALHTEGK